MDLLQGSVEGLPGGDPLPRWRPESRRLYLTTAALKARGMDLRAAGSVSVAGLCSRSVVESRRAPREPERAFLSSFDRVLLGINPMETLPRESLDFCLVVLKVINLPFFVAS